jgi:hypothetical protein
VPNGAAAPDETSYTIGGVSTKKYAFDGNVTTETLGNTFEIAHDIDLTKVNDSTLSIELHIHAAPTTNDAGVGRFVVDWCYIPPNGAPIAGTQLVLLLTIEANKRYNNTLTAGNLALPVGGFALGGIIEFSLSRTPSHADDTYAPDIALYKCALHVPTNRRGSNTIYA